MNINLKPALKQWRDEQAEPMTQEPVHPDDEAVDRFAAAMKVKLAKKRAEGRGGWEDKGRCSAEFLNRLLNEHVGKGDPVDVGNLAMMLWNRGERTTTEPAKQEPVDMARGFSLWLDRESWGHIIDGLILERERSEQRKSANPESNSNYIADRCAELITQINEAGVSLNAAPVQPVKHEPVAYLDNGTRFKVTLTDSDCYIKSLPRELGGRWVALVAAEDDCHIKGASVDAKAIQDALLFLVQRCNEQGFHSPVKQTVVQNALAAIRGLK